MQVNTVKTCVYEPTILQVSLTRFLYIGILVENEAVQARQSTLGSQEKVNIF